MRLRARTPYEWQEQVALIEWVHLHEAVEPRFLLLYHPANGGKRDGPTAAKLQRMGVRPGVPDLHLPVVVRHHETTEDGGERWTGYYGCWIELKRRTLGRTSQEQHTYHELLRVHGHYVTTCYGWLEAAKTLSWYLQRGDLAKELL